MIIDEIILQLDRMRDPSIDWDVDTIITKLEQLRPLIKTELDIKKIELADYFLRKTFSYDEDEEHWDTYANPRKDIEFSQLITQIKQMEKL